MRLWQRKAGESLLSSQASENGSADCLRSHVAGISDAKSHGKRVVMNESPEQSNVISVSFSYTRDNVRVDVKATVPAVPVSDCDNENLISNAYRFQADQLLTKLREQIERYRMKERLTTDDTLGDSVVCVSLKLTLDETVVETSATVPAEPGHFLETEGNDQTSGPVTHLQAEDLLCRLWDTLRERSLR